MIVDMPIGKFSSLIEEFNNEQLYDQVPVPIKDFGVTVTVPSGTAIINSFIKKFNLPTVEVKFNNGYVIRVANTHIFQRFGSDVFAKTLRVGDTVDHLTGSVHVVSIRKIESMDCYDISIDTPHVYYDANGVLHHNTVITAVLSDSVSKYGRSIVIVPNKSLVTQTEVDYVNMGLDVGVYFGDRKEHNRTHTICTWQSLNVLLKKAETQDRNSTYRLLKDPDDISIYDMIEGVVAVIVDETHQAKADALKALLSGPLSKVPIRWGLTGTVPKEDYARQSIFCMIGNVVGSLSASTLQEAGHLSQCNINILQLVDHAEFKDYQSELKYLVTNAERMRFIAKLINKIKNSGNTLILLDRVEAGRMLVAELTELYGDANVTIDPDVVFISGATKSATRKEHFDEVAESTNKVIISTYGLAAVGINLPRIFNLVLIEPGKSFVRVIQSIGRGIRKAEDKDHVEIYDITSSCKFSKRHLTKRKEFYREAKYQFSVEKVDWK